MAVTKISDLGSTFRQYFEIVPALSDALKDEVYRIRHQVYCEDLKFEPARSDKRETDEYDLHSLHLLIRSVKTNEFIGCTRIVRPLPDDPYYPLPFEKACATLLTVPSLIRPSYRALKSRKCPVLPLSATIAGGKVKQTAR